MQSENFDKKIKDSLSQPPPGNDNPAWDKMEALLDRHMPVKERQEKIFAFFGFLLLGGGAFLTWKNNTGNKNEITSISSEKRNTGTKENNNPTKTGQNIPFSIVPEPNNTKAGGSGEIPHTNSPDPLPGDKIKINSAEKIVSRNKKANNTDVKQPAPVSKL
jgi:hypothetical protein